MKFLKMARKDLLATAIVYIAAGLILFLFPETTARTIGYAFACVLLCVGIMNVFNYMMRDARSIYYHNDLVIASICLISGIAVFVNVETVVGFIPFILGVFVLVSGVMKLQNALNLHRINRGGSKFVLVLAVLNVIIGIILVLNPFHAVKLFIMIIGAGLLFSGITDLFINFSIAKKIRSYEEDNAVIEGVVLSEEGTKNE